MYVVQRTFFYQNWVIYLDSCFIPFLKHGKSYHRISFLFALHVTILSMVSFAPRPSSTEAHQAQVSLRCLSWITSYMVTMNPKTLIDLILVNNEHRVVQAGAIPSSISDHSVILAQLKIGLWKSHPGSLNTDRTNIIIKKIFWKVLSSVPWSTIDFAEDIDNSALMSKKLYTDVANNHAPIKFAVVKGVKTPSNKY